MNKPAAATRSGPRRAASEAAPALARTAPIEVVISGTLPPSDPYLAALRKLNASGAVRVNAWVRPADDERAEPPIADLRVVPTLDRAAAPNGSLVIFGARTRTQPSQIAAALKKGCHVFCRYGIAGTARDAAPLLALAQQQNRILVSDFHWRFQPAAEYVRDLCRDEVLGPMFAFSIHEGTPPGDETTNVWPPDGVLSTAGPASIDLLSWWLGPPTLLNYEDDSMGGVEANAVVELSFAQNVRGTIQLSHDSAVTPTYKLLFERGIIHWESTQGGRLSLQLTNTRCALEASLAAPLPPTIDPWRPAASATDETPQLHGLQNVLRSVRGQEPLRRSGDEALRLLALLDECYARRRFLSLPWFSNNETARARALSSPTEARRV